MRRSVASLPRLALVAGLAVGLALGPAVARAGAESLAFVGARVHPVSGPALADGVLLVEGDTITAVGSGLAVPPGARVVDLTGKHLYPSFIHPASVLGLVEITAADITDDSREIGEVNTHIRSEVGFNADSELLPVTVSGGVLLAHVVPQGGVLSGTSAVMRLSGWNWQDMTLTAPVGMHLRYPALLPSSNRFRRRTAEEVDKERKEALETLETTLEDARAYGKAKRVAAAGSGPEPVPDPRLEALQPLLDGEMPLFLHADEKSQIESALDWAAEQGFDKVILVAGADAALVAERLAAEGIPVILNGVLTLPSRRWEAYDTPYSAAACLQEAGVRFAIGDGGSGFGAPNARNLPFEAAMAAAFGLPAEEALRSITLYPAQILGIDGRFGSLEPGKEATFVVTDGDPLEIRTRVEGAWLAGRELDLDDRQKRLYRRYAGRPLPSSDSAEP